MHSTESYIVVVVQRDGSVIHHPEHPESHGEYPWDWCWQAEDRQRWREAFVQACMFRRPQADVPISLRVDDTLYEYNSWLEPAGDDLVVCRLVRQFSQTLTAQERTVLSLVAGGANNKEIAQTLGTKPSTVRSHIASMRRKLGVARPEGLLLAALQMGAAVEAGASSATVG